MLKWHYIHGLVKGSEKWAGGGPHLQVDLYRASVPGGWLVAGIIDGAQAHCLAPTFVPDPEHKWDGTSTDYDRNVDG